MNYWQIPAIEIGKESTVPEETKEKALRPGKGSISLTDPILYSSGHQNVMFEQNQSKLKNLMDIHELKTKPTCPAAKTV